MVSSTEVKFFFDGADASCCLDGPRQSWRSRPLMTNFVKMEDLPYCIAISMGRKGHMRFKPLDFDGFWGSDTPNSRTLENYPSTLLK